MNPSVPQKNGTTLWGISIDKWVSLLQSIGIPTLFMIFVCYLAWTYVPPVVSAHMRLLERNGDALESMEHTLKENMQSIQKNGDAIRENMDNTEETVKLMRDAAQMMKGTPEQRAEMVKLLREISDTLKKENP